MWGQNIWETKSPAILVKPLIALTFGYPVSFLNEVAWPCYQPCTSEALLDRSVDPYTVMALHRDREFKVAQVACFKRVGWRRVAFIYEESAADQEYVDHFRELVEAADGHIVAEERVVDMNNLDFHLLNLKAYLAGMYGAKYGSGKPLGG
ncbi:uncharacterized protein LOC117301663 isoform X2 [Asterias rubens]|uniref:uncharacterized protein LOC117301663 isoform X2 n=1 Tax=Asterias rubens TaxID=7604 RepID=UPI0014554991|nr:uncharacterized protein LOC117301663 isoform X2 [Asterias rubens]